MTNPTNRKN